MKKIFAIATAAALTAGLTLGSIGSSVAAPPHPHNNNNNNPGLAFGAGVLGFMAGAAAASAANNGYRDPYYNGGYYGGPGWDQHVARCAATYKTYSPNDDSYTTTNAYGQYIRVPCQL